MNCFNSEPLVDGVTNRFEPFSQTKSTDSYEYIKVKHIVHMEVMKCDKN